MSSGSQPPPDGANTGEEPGREPADSNGSSGEGSSSALARMISQEQARVVPGAPEDAPTGGSA